MQVAICYDSGCQIEGIVLSVDSTGMRVAVRNWEDVAEFRLRNGQWFSEGGEEVEIHSLVATSRGEWCDFCSLLANVPGTCGSCRCWSAPGFGSGRLN